MKSHPTINEMLVRALRVPGPHVPGWFPLVAERAHRLCEPATGVQTVDVLGSRMSIDVGEYMQRRFYYHCYESQQVRFFQRWLRRGDVVVDVGAHVGLFTLLAARQVGPTGEVHAFEPVPVNFARLEQNVDLNGLTNVRPERAALGDREGQVSLGLQDERLLGESTCDYTIGAELGSVSAPETTLDAYLQRSEGRPLRLVKVDVEGFERNVIMGMAHTIDNAPPEAIVFEHNAQMLLAHGAAPGSVFEDLTAAGYCIYRLGSRGTLRRAPTPEELVTATRKRNFEQPPKSKLRLGLGTRNTLFNAVAIHSGAIDR